MNEDELKHVGVIGMRWGHRKAEIEGAVVARKKGQEVHHVSEQADLSLRKGSFYTSFTKKDILKYRSDFATLLIDNRNVRKVFDHSYKTATDLITPNKKKAIDEYLALCKKDKTIVADIANTRTKTNKFLSVVKYFGYNSTKKQTEKYQKLLDSNKQEDKEKAFHDFMAYSLLDNKSQKKYFDALRKKGFNSIYDFNDVLNKYAEKPLIIFDAKNKLIPTGSEKFGRKQAGDAAVELYNLNK